MSYTSEANTNATARSTTLTIAGQSFAVAQAESACTYTLTLTSHDDNYVGDATYTDVDHIKRLELEAGSRFRIRHASCPP